MDRAAYLVLIKRACRDYTDDFIEWHLPLARGWALILASALIHGEAMIWPQIERSELGRQFLKIEERVRARRAELGLKD